MRLWMKEIAEKKGVSMGKLSRVTDVSYKTVKRIYDNPYYRPTLITLGRLAKALDVHTAELIEDIPDTSPGDP